MIKLLIISLLAIANCQNVIEIGGSQQRTGYQFQSPSGIRSYTGLTGLSNLGSFGGARTYNLNAARPVAFSLGNYGLGNYGVSNLGSYGYGLSGLSGLGGLSLGSYGVSQPQTYALVAAQPAVAQVAAQPIAVVAAAQPASVNVVSGGVQQLSYGAQHQSQQVVPVNAAIHSTRTVEYRAVPYNDAPLVPQDVIVEASQIPLNIHFKSRSSNIQVSQSHEAGEPGTVEQTSSQDEPSRVVHEVQKPVIQEVREVITPYRQVTQEVQPVVETIHTVVSRGEGVRQHYVAQPAVQQQVQQVRQVQAVSQPVATFQAVQQPAVSSFSIQQQQPVAQLAIAQPISVQQQPAYTLAIAQPVSTGFQSIAARPASFSFGAVQPSVQSYSLGVAQPVQGSLVQSVRSVQQPASVYSYSAQPVVSSVSVDSQPAVSFRSGNSGVSSLVGVRSASLPSVGASFTSYSSSNSASSADSDDDSK